MFKSVINSLDNIANAYCKICPNCNRKVPTYDFFVKSDEGVIGCRWCDATWHRRKKECISLFSTIR